MDPIVPNAPQSIPASRMPKVLLQ